ncbi:MAG: hypothetical protein ABSG46_08010 [Candidatus Binataceae bacterium]|jgi:hypothetical protein
MAGRRIELELPEELWQDLERIADSLGMGNPAETALVGIADWIARRKAELDDRDPDQRYFINEALDQLMDRGKR